MRYLKNSLLLCSLLFIGACTQLPNSGKSTDTKAVAAVVDQYRQSIETLDLGLAERVWLIDGNITFIHPRGHERGWGQIKKDFYEQTMGAMFAERKLAVRDVQVTLHGDAAYVEFYWNFEAKLRSDGSILHTAGRESQALIRTRDGWRLAHVHYSSMPVTGERQGF